jgi:hypothetical protein
MYPAVEPVKVRREKVRGNDWNEISVYWLMKMLHIYRGGTDVIRSVPGGDAPGNNRLMTVP